ncbi:zinc finger BED domain-containing protein 5-like [Oratosquilla oratoria]|uniref:zinc finger BED domain-containing protein 5-like n=1 Tax=Oratosquilla oratoria TaxID=337810 RepID=UPI003F759FD5
MKLDWDQGQSLEGMSQKLFLAVDLDAGTASYQTMMALESGEVTVTRIRTMRKVRKYDDSYIKFGFIENKDGKPKCVICLQVLSNDAMKPSKLRRHLETKHPDCAQKSKSFFERKREVYHQQQTMMTGFTTIPQKAQRASYLTAQRIARSKKPHTIGEELVLPAAVEICEVMIGKEAASTLKCTPLSNDTVRRRIEDMSCDIKSQLVTRLRACPFSIQLDESTDVLNCVQLIVFVRYPWNGHFVEDFLFCKMVPGQTTGEQIFNILDNFMTETKLNWENCIAVCTDGAAAMTGCKSGVVARIKRMNPQIVATHCMLHREALASKDMAPDLHSVLSTVVHDVVHYVKSRPLQSWLFSQLCNEMGAGHDTLLFHPEVRWLSRGKVLQRVFELRTELCDFLKDAKPPTAMLLSDPRWVAQLAYLADMFNIMNELNLSMQGGYASVLEVSDKI